MAAVRIAEFTIQTKSDERSTRTVPEKRVTDQVNSKTPIERVEPQYS